MNPNVCMHDEMRRQCDRCWANSEIEKLEARIAAALRHVRAYRDGVILDPKNALFRIEGVLSSESESEDKT